MFSSKLSYQNKPILKLTLIKIKSTLKTMASDFHSEKLLKTIFIKSVDSVKPASLLEKALEIQQSAADSLILKIYDKDKQTASVDITDRKIHCIGFGKAVLGMAVALEKAFPNLQSGIVSVPTKIGSETQLQSNTVIKVYEGAENNLPDSAAEQAARHIKQKAESMTSEDVLIVLISGGGSALLPIPKPPVTLSEKIAVIKLLANKGATINELNVVRIAISAIKGGKLLESAKNAAHVVSLILSDVVNDPIDLIASGPTVPFYSSKMPCLPIEILEKYNLLNDIPKSVREVLNNENRTEFQTCSNSTVHVIGSNSIAIETSAKQALIAGFQPIVLSKGIQGRIQDLAANYTELGILVQNLMLKKITKTGFEEKLVFVKPSLCLESVELENDIYAALACENSNGICFIAGGEPTAIVTGSGKGGRNQELALRFIHECQKRKAELASDTILFLSAGTDGIDGPTKGAGAIGGLKISNEFLNSGQPASIKEFLQNNDSFTFYENLCQGKYHVITGHTGTNVMDLHLLIVPNIWNTNPYNNVN